ncbi:MAG TPA: CinA family nicotinamide mononucleotide deamidase-related protein [Planctomycetota bacterium]|nr:CinA family nicotinamide mononucleotide deamidase-related protein [Planctomycetota bacterium]
MTVLAEILAIGDELVHGALLDTNSRHIARELEANGALVRRFTVVGDDPAELAPALAQACARAELVVATGGLGPTLDDRTRECAAALTGPLEFDAPSWAAIQAYLRGRRRPVPDSNRRQAMFPRGAVVLGNPVGTAPGFRLRIGKAELFALPGVPREMQRLLADHVLPFLRQLPGTRPLAQHYLRVLGPSEALLGERIEPFMVPGREPAVGITAGAGMLTIRIVGAGASVAAAAASCQQTAAELRPLLGEWLFAEGRDSLAELLVAAAVRAGCTLACAESCTGGMVAAALTDVAGVSAVFRGGVVAYADAAKVSQLSVAPELIAAHGAVSEPVAAAMAAGARQQFGADLAVAVTGIAGPAGGSAEKPVGTVCFGLADAAAPRTWTLAIPDFGREFVRERATVEALVALLRAVRRKS